MLEIWFIGGVIFPIIFHWLQPTVGFGWAVRTIGFIMLVTQIAVICLLRTRLQPTGARTLIDSIIVWELSFILLFPIATITYVAVFIPIIYLLSYRIEYYILDPNLGFYLAPIFNAATIPGRLIPAIIAQKFTGIMNIIFILHVIMGVLAFAWKSMSSRTRLIIFTLASGFIGSTGLLMYALIPIPFIWDPKVIGTRIDMISVFAGFGILFGSPIAGVLLQKDTTYFRLQAFTGGLMFGSAFLLLVAWYLFTNGKLISKL